MAQFKLFLSIRVFERNRLQYKDKDYRNVVFTKYLRAFFTILFHLERLGPTTFADKFCLVFPVFSRINSKNIFN